ncbi:MAG: hypothetical protein WCP39_03625 [Chlamydiota bacterium]
MTHAIQPIPANHLSNNTSFVKVSSICKKISEVCIIIIKLVFSIFLFIVRLFTVIPCTLIERFKKNYNWIASPKTPIAPPSVAILPPPTPLTTIEKAHNIFSIGKVKAKELAQKAIEIAHKGCEWASFGYRSLPPGTIPTFIKEHKKEVALTASGIATFLLVRNWAPFRFFIPFRNPIQTIAVAAGALWGRAWCKKNEHIMDAAHTSVAVSILKDLICDKYFKEQLDKETNILSRSWIRIQVSLSHYVLQILDEVKKRLAEPPNQIHLIDNEFFKFNLSVANLVLKMLKNTFIYKQQVLKVIKGTLPSQEKITIEDDKKLYQTFVFGIDHYSKVLEDMRTRLDNNG